VSDVQFPERFVDGALDHFGAIDIVVNNGVDIS
jgi:NAD(P)-dependent dehydrogenase (short-subunit alcohol dehydrogenase family)